MTAQLQRLAVPSLRSRYFALTEAATGIGVFVTTLATYLLTAPRSVASSDSAELTAAAASLGIPHPPGYPLYVLIGRTFAAVPIENVAFRLNVMSAIFGALAALLVYAIVLELTRHRLSAVVAALSLTFSYHFWGESLVAEVYTLDAALVGGIVYALCIWQRTRRPVVLYAAFFLFGLSLAHRTTSVLLLPPLISWALISETFRYRGIWLRAIPWLLPGLALYLLLPLMFLANPGYLWNVGYDASGDPLYVDLTTINGLRWYVTAAIFQPLAFAFGPAEALRETARYAGWLWSEFAGVGIIVGLIGLASAWRRHRAFFQLTVGAFVLQAWFFINYAALDKDQMFLITYLIWAIWLGLGVKELIDLSDKGFVREFAAPAARALVIAVPVALFAANVSSLNFSGDEPIRQEAEQLFATAPTDAIIIGPWGDIAGLQYFQTVERQRLDLKLVAQWSLTDQHLQQLVGMNIGQRAVYILNDAPTLRDDYRFIEIGEWFRLEPFISTGGN